MAAVSPSPDSPPSGVPLSPTITPLSAPSTPGGSPPPSSTPPLPSAIPPTPSAPPPLSNSSPPSAPPPSNSGPPPITPPPSPVVSSPPPEIPNAPPPTPNASPPLTPVTPPMSPPIASPPPSPSFSPPPPQGEPPPISSPSPENAPPPSPPVGEPPSSPPPLSPGPPPPPPGPPPTSTPPPPPKSHTTPPTDRPSVSPPPPPPSPSETPKSPPSPSPPPPAQPPRGVPSRPPPPLSHAPPPPSAVTPPSRPGSPSRPNASPPKDSPLPAVEIPPPSSFTPPGPSKTVPVPPRSSNESGPVQPPGINGNNGLSKSAVIAIGVVSGIVLLAFIGLIAFWVLKRKKRSSGANNGHIIPASTGSSPRSDNLLVKSDSNFGGGSDTDHGGFGHSRSWFTYQELSEATGGFSDENLLGEGGFGCVYKGQLVDGRVVAVKQLKIGGGQGEREFRAEVEIISRIHHRHLVSLVGYCIWESKRLLVYDYVPNNTLHFHLHGEGTPVLDWATRVKIAVGAARGITYLHEDCHPRIIHRDIKSSNILIDNNYEAQVSDFGLAKLAMDADTHVSTRVMGTFGYMAPEYATSGKLTDKSDVFSFGVVLLELITGRKPVDSSQPLGDEGLVQWARPLLKHALDTGEFDGLVDARLNKNYVESEMYRMIEAAAACVRHSSSKRPKMGQIVRALGVTDTGDLTNGLKVGESQLYTSAQQSADIRWFRRMAFGGSPDSSSDAFSQPTTQSSGYSTNSRQDMYFSAQPVQGGTSGQFSQALQNRNLSGQREINVDMLDERLRDANISRQPEQKADMYFSAEPGQGGTSGQFTQASQNRSFSGGQHDINVDILDDRSPDANRSRQQNQNPHHPNQENLIRCWDLK